jgi:hypothetical protein
MRFYNIAIYIIQYKPFSCGMFFYSPVCNDSLCLLMMKMRLSTKDKISEDIKSRLGNYNNNNNNFVIRDAVRQIPHIGDALDSTLAFLGRKIGKQSGYLNV